MNCEFAGHSAYKDYVSTVTDPVNDPITAGLSDYIVTDELYHPHVFDRERSTIFLTAFDCTRDLSAAFTEPLSLNRGMVALCPRRQLEPDGGPRPPAQLRQGPRAVLCARA